MAVVSPRSCLCVKSELDLFSMPPTQTSIENGFTVDYHPISSLTDNGPIEFSIPGTGDDYVDLANTFLHVGVQVIKGDGTNLAADSPVGPANLFLHSLFQQVDVSLNNKLISSSTNTYAYRAYMETLLNYGKQAKESQLTAALWYKDTTGKMDERVVTDVGGNKGLVKRAQFTKESKTVDLIGRLHSDIFFQEKLLLNGVPIRIKLTRSKDSFALKSAGVNPNFKIKIMYAMLRCRKVRISPSVYLAHAKALEHANAVYPMRRVECKTFTISNGNLNSVQENLFQGQIPSRVIVGIVDNEAYNGSYAKNPFNFKNYKIINISLKTDGQDGAAKQQTFDFGNGKIIDGYWTLLQATGKVLKDVDIDISREDYVDGYTLFGWDLSPDLCEDDHFNLVKTGSVRLSIDFAEALPNTVNVITYAEFENILEVDRNRNVFYDVSV
jgi:hypothetical protein